MTEATLDDETVLWTSDGVNSSLTVYTNFTIAFWAQARESLNFSETPSAVGISFEPRGSLFMLLEIISSDSQQVGIGFFLGTDGFSIQQSANLLVSSIVVQRQPLIGWHHYTIVCENNEVFVYIDGSARDSSTNRAVNAVTKMGFRLAFGRTRYRYTYYGSGFEGWISELRLANRTMLGGEAYALMSNASAWTSSYAMNGCSVKENPLRFSSSVTLPTCPSMSTCHQDHFAVETPSAAISLHRITSRRSVAAAFSGFARQRTSGASAARRPGAWSVAPVAHAAASAS
jgi:hypothetical protein